MSEVLGRRLTLPTWGFLVVRRGWTLPYLILFCALAVTAASAQGSYEIQVYGAETVAPKSTMVELHSNFTISGTKPVPGSRYGADGTFPTNHAEHETLEITQGWGSWAEVGFYVFTSTDPREGFQWVGDHIRPRVRAPESWHLPVGLSLSNEFGYQRARFSPDTWTWEFRPIVDKQVGRWYLAFNPAFDRSWHGPGIRQGVTFSPNVKAGYDFTRKVNVGVEYYGSYGDLAGFDALRDQQQQFFVVTDLNLAPEWEVNFGVGLGATSATDHLLVKGIVGRRFSWPHGATKAKLQQP